MQNLANTQVGQIVAQNFRTAKVFSSHGIDFCCNGGISLQAACQKLDIDQEVVIKELKDALNVPLAENFRDMPMDELTRYIQEVHHTYIRNTIPALTSYLKKIAAVHGQSHPELLEVRDLFLLSAEELLKHMSKEEKILFPYIQEMSRAHQENRAYAQSKFGHVKNPIAMMNEEHETEGDRFKKIAELTNNYSLPNDACQTYKVAFSLLQEFEQDLHKHIHLENNILFPSAIASYDQRSIKDAFK